MYSLLLLIPAALTAALDLNHLEREKRDNYHPTYAGKFFESYGSCSGYLHSPNFPKPFQDLDFGYYSIEVPANNRVSLEIQLFSLGSSDGCTSDHVAIHDGSSSDDPLLAKLCGKASNFVYHGSSNCLFVAFRSDSQETSFGFQMFYYSTPQSGAVIQCNGNADKNKACEGGFKVLQAESGYVASPAYPSDYESDLDCGWAIDVSQYGSRMSLQWTSGFRLESSRSCKFDHIEVFDSSVIKESNDRFCGGSGPESGFTEGPYYFITFISDPSTNYKGFEVTFSASGQPLPEYPPQPDITTSPYKTTKVINTTPYRTTRHSTTTPYTTSRTTATRTTTTPYTTRSSTAGTQQTTATYPQVPDHLLPIYRLRPHGYFNIKDSIKGFLVSPGFGSMYGYSPTADGYVNMVLDNKNVVYKFTAISFVVGPSHLTSECLDKVTITETGESPELEHGPYCGSDVADFGTVTAATPLRFSFKAFNYRAEGFKILFEAISLSEGLTIKKAVCGRSLVPPCASSLSSDSHCADDNAVNVVHDARPHSHPWQAALTNSNKSFVCGATIIHPQWVITAARCVEGYLAKDIQVNIGLHLLTHPIDQKSALAVEEIIVNPNYTAQGHAYDIALLRVRGGIDFTEKVSAICMSYSADLFENLTATITGWQPLNDDSGSDVLKEQQVTTLSVKECAEFYLTEPSVDLICAACDGACLHNSGGPLVLQRDGHYYLAGVYSWSGSCFKGGCPGIYTRMSRLYEWMAESLSGVN